MKLLVLSHNLKRASFRQRIGIYLDTLHTNGIDTEVVQLPTGYFARRKLFKRAMEFDGVFLHKKKLNFLDALCLRRYARKVIYDFDDAVMYSEKNPPKPSHKRLMSFQRTVKMADLVIAGNSYLAEHERTSMQIFIYSLRDWILEPTLCVIIRKTMVTYDSFGLAVKVHYVIL